MRLNTFKNYIGLCACKGCFNRLEVKIEVETENEAGVKVLKKRFWLCHDCTWKLLEPDLTEDD